MCARHGTGATADEPAGWRLHAAAERGRQRVRGVRQRRPRTGRLAAARRPSRRCRRHDPQRRRREVAGENRARRFVADISRRHGTAGGSASGVGHRGRRGAAARGDELRQPAVRRPRSTAGRGAIQSARTGARAASAVSEPHERGVRARRGGRQGPHPDLGTRRRPHDLVRHRFLRLADCGGRVRRRRRHEPGHRARRHATRGVARGQRHSPGQPKCSSTARGSGRFREPARKTAIKFCAENQ